MPLLTIQLWIAFGALAVALFVLLAVFVEWLVNGRRRRKRRR